MRQRRFYVLTSVFVAAFLYLIFFNKIRANHSKNFPDPPVKYFFPKDRFESEIFHKNENGKEAIEYFATTNDEKT